MLAGLLTSPFRHLMRESSLSYPLDVYAQSDNCPFVSSQVSDTPSESLSFSPSPPLSLSRIRVHMHLPPPSHTNLSHDRGVRPRCYLGDLRPLAVTPIRPDNSQYLSTACVAVTPGLAARQETVWCFAPPTLILEGRPSKPTRPASHCKPTANPRQTHVGGSSSAACCLRHRLYIAATCDGTTGG